MSGKGRHRRHGWRPAIGRPRRGLVYFGLCLALLATAGLTLTRYFEQSPAPPAPSGSLGAIPAAVTADGPDGAPLVRGPQTPGSSSELELLPTPPPPPAPPPPSFSLPPSPPVSMQAAGVAIDSAMGQIGINKDGTVEVPTDYHEAAWYRLGPTPGALGPAVILGHVDSYKGPGVFFNLGNSKPGQVIDVTRADKTVAHFRVDAVNTYPKDAFPTDAVYGPINYAGLRLVTCGGRFDEKSRSYESNIVIFATLVQS